MASDILSSFELPYVEAQILLSSLRDYSNPRDWIARQVKKGELIRLKNGFYLIARKCIQGYPFEQIANVLYGPSYVSLHWALSYYGMIPERTTEVTSVTLRRNKEFRTSIGVFSYHFLGRERYSIAFDQKGNSDGKGRFLIATPEKATIDFIYFYCKESTPQTLLKELIDSHRISREDLKNLDFFLLKEIAQRYRSPIIRTFIKSLGYL